MRGSSVEELWERVEERLSRGAVGGSDRRAHLRSCGRSEEGSSVEEPWEE